MKKSSTKLYNWAIQKASSSKAPLWIALLFFLEIALFIPLDAVFMFFCLQKRKNIFLYVIIATLASAASGLVGYLFGHFLWDLVENWVVPHLISSASFLKMSAHIDLYESWAIFFGSLLPFPLKILSLASGVFQLGVFSFLTFFTLARLLRFGLIGGMMALYGEKVKTFVDRHFHRIFMVLGAKVAAAFLFFWVMAK